MTPQRRILPPDIKLRFLYSAIAAIALYSAIAAIALFAACLSGSVLVRIWRARAAKLGDQGAGTGTRQTEG